MAELRAIVGSRRNFPAPEIEETLMNSSFARRIATALAGPAVAAGILTGGIALSASAQAQPNAGNACTTSGVPAATPNPNTLNPLTRAAQVKAVSPAQMQSGAVSCLGH
jgi:hypothetical protein